METESTQKQEQGRYAGLDLMVFLILDGTCRFLLRRIFPFEELDWKLYVLSLTISIGICTIIFRTFKNDLKLRTRINYMMLASCVLVFVIAFLVAIIKQH